MRRERLLLSKDEKGMSELGLYLAKLPCKYTVSDFLGTFLHALLSDKPKGFCTGIGILLKQQSQNPGNEKVSVRNACLTSHSDI